MPTEKFARRPITILLDDETRQAAREAMTEQVTRAQVVALQAARELDVDDGKDKRTGALAITKSLARSARLADLADELDRAWEASPDELRHRIDAGELGIGAAIASPASPLPDPRRLLAAARRIIEDKDVKVSADNGAALQAFGELTEAVNEYAAAEGALVVEEADRARRIPSTTRAADLAATQAELDRINGQDATLDGEPGTFPSESAVAPDGAISPDDEAAALATLDGSEPIPE